MKYLTSSGIILFRKKKNRLEYLLLQYPHGHWDFPKGKIESGETQQKAALRELKEETNLSAVIVPGFQEQYDYIFKQDGELYKKIVTFFIGHTRGGQVKLSYEHIGYAWLSFDQALEQLTFTNAQQLLKQVHAFLHLF